MKSSTSDWGILTGLIALSLVPAVAGTARLAQLAGDAALTPENARFLASPTPVLIHVPAAIIFSLLGALQFAPGFRRRHREWHRVAGALLVLSALLTALSGLWMAHFYPWPEGDGRVLYVERLVAGAAMIVSIGLGIDAIRRRDFAAHGNWMLRAYAIGLGAGTQVLTHLPWFLLVDTRPGEWPRAVMMGAGWVINAGVAEWSIRRRQGSRSGMRRTAPRRARMSRATTPLPVS